MNATSARPQGLACMQCFKSKCKCVMRPGSDGCERCHRLRKQCCESDAVRKSAARKKHDSASQIANLEGRVSDLVRLLQSGVQAGTVPLQGSGARHEKGSPENGQHASASTEDNASRVAGNSADASPPSLTSGSSLLTASPAAELFGAGDASDETAIQPTPLEAERQLAHFRNTMLPTFPFIHLPASLTVEKLRQERPFLLRAIIAVAPMSTPQRLAHGRELKRTLSQLAIVQFQSNIDLLLGVLVYIAWSYDQFLNRAGTLSRLMLLAESLAFDLRLDKPLPPDEHMMKPIVDGSYGDITDVANHQLVIEEQRALLACFCLNTIISSYFAQIDGMSWKPRMTEALQAIEATPQCATDELFAYQVRFQLMARKAVWCRESAELASSYTMETSSPAMPTLLYLEALRIKLLQIRNAAPASVQKQGIFELHVHYSELCISEAARTALGQAPLRGKSGVTNATSGDGGDSSVTGDGLAGHDALEVLWRSVMAVKGFMDVHLRMPVRERAAMSFIHVAQRARCLVVLYRLSTYNGGAWDCDAVRRAVDILRVLELSIDELEQASRDACERAPDGLYLQLAAMMRRFHAAATARLTAVAVPQALANTSTAAAPGDGTSLNWFDIVGVPSNNTNNGANACQDNDLDLTRPTPTPAPLASLDLDFDDSFLDDIFGAGANWAL